VIRVLNLIAREILDSRGRPTVEVTAVLTGGAFARASVPSGASRGSREAFEKRDGEPNRFRGLGVRQVALSIETEILQAIRGLDTVDLEGIDRTLIDLDGTAQKERLGANAILAVSLAVARAAARARNRPLYASLGGDKTHLLPLPFLNVINGGVHAPGGLDIQEFLVVPWGADSFSEAIRWSAEIYLALGEILKRDFALTGVGDEGGYVAGFKSHESALDVLVRAIERTGLRPGTDVALAIDAAASEFFDEDHYVLKRTGSKPLSGSELIDLYEKWIDRYPIVSIEDGLAEGDDQGWIEITSRLGKRVQVLGDDNFVTNPDLVRRGGSLGIANAVLIKPNQIGTLSETIQTMEVCVANGFRTMVSHRSGETCDDFIADLAVATEAGQIKSGAPCRGERVAKYNRLLEIERELGDRARFADRSYFSSFRRA
jgi:enolase